MSLGQVKVWVDGESYYGNILTFKDEYLSGKHLKATYDNPEEFPTLNFSSGIAEVYDLNKDSIIEDIVIDEIYQNVEFCPSTYIKNSYYDFNNLAFVIEFV